MSATLEPLNMAEELQENDNNNSTKKTAQYKRYGHNPYVYVKSTQPAAEADFESDTELRDWKDPEFYLVVDRDYSGVWNYPTDIRFSVDFPHELIGAVPEKVFVATIEGINDLFLDVERISWGTTLESLLWYSTFTLMGCCRKTRLEKALLKVCSFIYEQNDSIYHPLGLHIVHPLANNLLAIGIRNISKYQLYSYNIINTAQAG